MGIKIPKRGIIRKKMKVLVKVFLLDDGDESELIRQFIVKGKEISEGTLAIKITEAIEKEWIVEDIEAWMV